MKHINFLYIFPCKSHESVGGGRRGRTPLIFNLGHRWKWVVVKFTVWSLYLRETNTVAT